MSGDSRTYVTVMEEVRSIILMFSLYFLFVFLYFLIFFL